MARPELLFLTQRIPYPPIKGEKIRPLQILRHLAKRYVVHLGCLIDDPDDWRQVKVIEALCGETYFAALNPRVAKITCLRGLLTGDPLSKVYFYNGGLAAWVDRLLAERRPQRAFICSSAMAQYVLDRSHSPARIVMDFADVDADKWRQYAETRSGPMRWVYARESRTLLAYDRRVGAAVDASTFVSPAEAALFRAAAPELAAKTYAINSGVDAEYFSPQRGFASPYQGEAVVFTGTMSYWPNVDAVTWFAAEIMPLIRRSRPGLQFYIVGSSPSPEVARLGSLPGIVVTGRVDDVRPYVAHAAAVVVPLRIANGIQNKVIEAMAMAKAVVATPKALTGVSLDREREVVVGDGAAGFAEAVLTTLARDDLATLGARARARVLESYVWETNLAGFDSLLEPG
jgi:sugar transferase (PEP-CTERM/EpsH1 system associated)